MTKRLNRVASCRRVALIALIAAPACGDSSSSSSDPPAPVDTTPTPPAGPECVVNEVAGTATFYDSSINPPACGFAIGEPLGVALAPDDYAAAQSCGACVLITSAQGSVIGQVIDRCDDCTTGNMTIAQTAYEQVGATPPGMTDVTWRFVPCGATEPIRYFFAPASNAYWLGVQLRNLENPVAKLEVLDAGGSFVELPRTDFNLFVAEQGLGPGPFTFRVTDVYGQELRDEAILLSPDGEVAGAAQFPACVEPTPAATTTPAG